ncbi:MAG: hypothetical protein EOP84_15305 [Verrucomicrobiaceae bacterium]|nr:MAG: hypothetical protein EOP84_15305 [Verrucomicrobiaceae bacterium]
MEHHLIVAGGKNRQPGFSFIGEFNCAGTNHPAATGVGEQAKPSRGIRSKETSLNSWWMGGVGKATTSWHYNQIVMRIQSSPQGERLTALPSLRLSEASYREVEHLQRMIVNSSEVFFGEIGESLFLIGQECRPRPDFVGDRIDILALDQQGASVIVELKRDRDKFQLLQSLSYAAMVSTWGFDDFVSEYSSCRGIDAEQAREELEEFLGASIESINNRQRVILVAEHFDFEVLATAEWLAEQYGLDIKCVKIALRADGEAHYIMAGVIFPASPLFDHAWRRRATNRSSTTTIPLRTWDEVFEQFTNLAIRGLAEKLVSTLPPKDANTKYWALYLRVGDKRTVNIEMRKEFAYIWQSRRFVGDKEFWNDRLGPGIDLQEVESGRALRFYLKSQADCDAYLIAQKELANQDYAGFSQAT